MSLGARQLLFAAIALILSLLMANGAGLALGLPTMVVGFALGWLLMRVLLKRGVDQGSAATSTVGTGAIAGFVLAIVLSAASGAVGESVPLVLAAAVGALVAGMVLAFRFSPKGGDSPLST
jgi:hypothetical protein